MGVVSQVSPLISKYGRGLVGLEARLRGGSTGRGAIALLQPKYWGGIPPSTQDLLLPTAILAVLGKMGASIWGD